ncbi:type II secretion system F family protein [Kitasatospora camelliae]|uniref:Type II secretion system F family protein n=1 Tax=Kitasatospora camelliae TaxID=3156397 RepID=A0AAU8JXA9_9ACTN
MNPNPSTWAAAQNGEGLVHAVACAATLAGVLLGLTLGAAGLRRRRRTVARARTVVPLAVGRAGCGGRGPTAALNGLRSRIALTRPRWLVAELLLLPVGLVLARATASVVPLLGAAALVAPLRRWRKRRRTAAEARRRATAVIDLCTGLAAELRSGSTPEQALHTVTSRAGQALRRDLGAEATARLAAGRYGGNVPAALRLVAELPGGSGAAAVAACWQVTADSGSGLAVGLDQVADALRAERALAEEIAGELAGPKTTIAVLAALPLLGLLLGAALGAQPVRVLLHTPAGLGCLLGGALLEAGGLLWTARLVRAAEGTEQGRGCPPGRREPDRPGARAGAADGCGLSRTRADLHAGGRAEVAW